MTLTVADRAGKHGAMLFHKIGWVPVPHARSTVRQSPVIDMTPVSKKKTKRHALPQIGRDLVRCERAMVEYDSLHTFQHFDVQPDWNLGLRT